ncbi:MAG: ACT domain-containing protein, partial [Deltaproteobacteria bacterium]
EVRIDAVRELMGDQGGEAARLLEGLPHALVMHFPPRQLAQLAALLLDASEGVGVRLWVDELRDETLAIVVAPDRPRLFARLAHAASRGVASIVAAQAYRLEDGRVLDVFHLQEPAGRVVAEPEDLERLKRGLERAAAEEGPFRPGRRKFKVHLLMRRVPVRVRVLPKASFRGTAIEVSCADQPGLLARLAAVIGEEGAEIFGASVSTFGERAVDVFFLSGPDGHALPDEAVRRLCERLAEAARLPGDEEDAA